MITDQLSRIAVAAWIRAQVHPTDCLCSFCAPISAPTRSPIINHLLAERADSALAHGLVRAHQLHVRKINQEALLAKCGFRVEGKLG